jgi:2-deoxy-D-gluconate 3-dehydrogenase
MKGGGKIIAFSCNSVIYNYPEMAAFTSVKAAVEGLIKAISNEWAGKGVSANAFALPTIKTKKVIDSKKVEDFKDYITPDELADIVLSFLKLPHNYINGSIIKLFKYNSSFYSKSYFERNPPSDKC